MITTKGRTDCNNKNLLKVIEIILIELHFQFPFSSFFIQIIYKLQHFWELLKSIVSTGQILHDFRMQKLGSLVRIWILFAKFHGYSLKENANDCVKYALNLCSKGLKKSFSWNSRVSKIIGVTCSSSTKYNL